MSIQNFDHGNNLAAGLELAGFDVPSSILGAIGIRGGEVLNPGVMVLELVDPVGQEELFTLTQGADKAATQTLVEWIDPTHIKLKVRDPVGSDIPSATWWIFYRLTGAGSVPVVSQPGG